MQRRNKRRDPRRYAEALIAALVGMKEGPRCGKEERFQLQGEKFSKSIVQVQFLSTQ